MKHCLPLIINLGVPIGRSHKRYVITGLSKTPSAIHAFLYPWPITLMEMVRVCNQPQRLNTSLFTPQRKLIIYLFICLFLLIFFCLRFSRGITQLPPPEIQNSRWRLGCGRGNSAVVVRFLVGQQNFLHCKEPKNQCAAYKSRYLVGTGCVFLGGKAIRA
jgi:hypothetical protein